MHERPLDGSVSEPGVGPQYERLHRLSNVLQTKRSQGLERETEPVADVLANGTRDAYRARRTLRLQSCRHVDAVAMHVAAVHNHVANVDADPEPDAGVEWSI